MNCKHCGKPFSCGCQKTTAIDGSVVHKTCLTAYQNKISNTVAKSDKLTQNIKKAYKNITRK
jgi:hypothetical protein